MTSTTPAGPAIDWPAVQAEALDIFVRYLQIPSVNPPGDEAPAARFLGSLIEREGIPVQYLETAPNREIVYARLPSQHGDSGSPSPRFARRGGRGEGSGSLMLCNHLDAVPVE